MYRSKRLLNAARGQDCTLQFDGICNGNPETTVAAHANGSRYGKGMGIKAHDCFIAWAYSSCHAELDQGKKFSKEEKAYFWQVGFEKTLLKMFLDEIIEVK